MQPLFWLTLMALAATTAMGQAPQPPFFNVVTLEASATLFVEEQGPDPGQLATRVNTRLEEALAKARTQPRVEARSGNYQTNPVYDRAGQISGWRTRADVILQGRDFKAVGALAGALQPALKLGSMTFSLSRVARQAAEATLLTEALGSYQEKARAIAKGLGFPGYALGQIAVRSDGPILHAPVAFRGVAMATMAEGPTPGPVPVEGGKNAVTVHVSGSVVLGPGK
jgi:predicted secreted protein